MVKKEEFGGMMAALVANMIFGFSFIFSKLALSVSQPLVILAVRFTFAFIFLNLLLLTGKIKISLKGKPKKRIFLMAICQPLLYFIFELYGLSLVSSALSGVIISLVPVAVMLLAVFFLKEKPTVIQVICTLLSIASVAAISVISNDNSKNYFWGIIMLVLAVACAAVFNLLSRSESENFNPFERTYAMFLIGFIGFNILGFVSLKGEYIPELLRAVSNIKFIAAILYLSLASSVLAFLLYNYSTSKISAVQSSSFSNIITVVTVMAGVVLLKEKFTFVEYLLCLIIILGVWGVNVFTNKKTA